MKIKLFAVVGISLILSVSCNRTDKYEKEEAAKIQTYLDNHPALDFQKKASGLYYLEVLTGPGPLAVTHDTAYVWYTGTYLSGTVFGTNVGTTDTLIFLVNEGWLIPGFDEGVTYMREGGKATFLLSSDLGYGNSGYYMAAYTPLLFDVELVKLIPGPGPGK
ncbi:MAG: FKBP-type peptidyl-prolyl cis-trans isomerase [Bacteroidales bacterium]|nr:FKBP-type peptidyl-prolyl cis-trans isomerase [Bacteroidales bacterium]